MCRIIRRFIHPKEVKGYKVAIDIKGVYYSPATAIEYKIGKVPVFTKEDIKEEFYKEFADCPLSMIGPPSPFYDIRHEGCTQVFKRIYDTKGLCNHIINKTTNWPTIKWKIGYTFNIAILEMAGPAVYEGAYGDGPTYLINEIKSLKLLHTVVDKNYDF